MNIAEKLTDMLARRNSLINENDKINTVLSRENRNEICFKPAWADDHRRDQWLKLNYQDFVPLIEETKARNQKEIAEIDENIELINRLMGFGNGRRGE